MGKRIPCDAMCGATVDLDTSKKIWMTRDGDDYQADLCESCFPIVEAELRKAGIALTPHIQPARPFAPEVGL